MVDKVLEEPGGLMRDEYLQQMINETRRLYLKYRGQNYTRIEREMRANDWPFYREMLYSRKDSAGPMSAWPEKYGWDAMLSAEDRARLEVIKIDRAKRRSALPNHKKFPAWLRGKFSEWEWGWKYQRYIYERLARVTSGECKRLMIFMPPRHGKSEMVTIRYAAWRLLQDPKLNLILGSYNQRLADKFSRRIKRIVSEPTALAGGTEATVDEGGVTAGWSVRACVPPTYAGGSDMKRRLNTASEWETAGGGVVRSVGVGAGIAGFGAGLVVIDDPVRNRADAESETYRERVWDWFNDDIYTRLEPNATIILIQTRWHEDDLAGRLLKEMEDGGEKWDVVCLPALSEPPSGVPAGASPSGVAKLAGGSGASNDERSFTLPCATTEFTPPAYAGGSDPLGRKPGVALCRERYDEMALARIKRKLGSYSFSALYQQNPAPAEGGRFKREWFKKIIDEAPPNLRWKRGYDLAVSTKTSADYTASFRCAKDKMGNLYIADGYRARLEYPDQRRYAIERMRNEKSTEHGIESALHGAAFVQEIRRDIRFGHIAFRSVKVDTDKLTRALAWLNLAEEGKVFLVRGPWIDEFVDEVARFPKGRHDDQIDAVSIAVNMMSQSDKRAYAF